MKATPATRRLGADGPEVSLLGLGCTGMSDICDPTDERESLTTIQAALEAGITLRSE
jgi:aryl-alcohol dehydrogenase-like predicted oxidoreductase